MTAYLAIHVLITFSLDFQRIISYVIRQFHYFSSPETLFRHYNSSLSPPPYHYLVLNVSDPMHLALLHTHFTHPHPLALAHARMHPTVSPLSDGLPTLFHSQSYLGPHACVSSLVSVIFRAFIFSQSFSFSVNPWFLTNHVSILSICFSAYISLVNHAVPFLRYQLLQPVTLSFTLLYLNYQPHFPTYQHVITAN